MVRSWSLSPVEFLNRPMELRESEHSSVVLDKAVKVGLDVVKALPALQGSEEMVEQGSNYRYTSLIMVAAT